jgi:hypothetical protein
MLYQNQTLPIRDSIATSHAAGFAAFSSAGSWFSGLDRVTILREARIAEDCNLCARRKAALSPYAAKGVHDSQGLLPESIVEVIHRIKTDSGRLTESWFNSVVGTDLIREAYVEIVGLVATSIILDSFATALGCELVEADEVQAGEPDRVSNDDVFDGGAWVPLYNLPQEMTATGLPSSPNILRAMGLVPSAIAHFFGVMRAHYALADLDFAIDRPQTELIAARVSSLNECFY